MFCSPTSEVLPARGGAQRIVCLTEETTEVLYRLGAEDRIVGISGFTVRPPRARREKPRVSAYTSANVPRILALEPDLVLCFSDMQADIAASLVRAGVSVHVFNQRSIDEIYTMIATLGALVAMPTRAAALIAELRAGVEAVRAHTAGLPRPRVYFEEWDSPRISAIRWVSELIEIAGGQDCFAERSTGRAARERFVRDDEVIARNPALIIGSWCGKKFRPEHVRARAGWEAIEAVRTGALYEIKSCDILQPGPAALTDGLQHLHRLIARCAQGVTA